MDPPPTDEVGPDTKFPSQTLGFRASSMRWMLILPEENHLGWARRGISFLTWRKGYQHLCQCEDPAEKQHQTQVRAMIHLPRAEGFG